MELLILFALVVWSHQCSKFCFVPIFLLNLSYQPFLFLTFTCMKGPRNRSNIQPRKNPKTPPTLLHKSEKPEVDGHIFFQGNLILHDDMTMSMTIPKSWSDNNTVASTDCDWVMNLKWKPSELSWGDGKGAQVKSELTMGELQKVGVRRVSCPQVPIPVMITMMLRVVLGNMWCDQAKWVWSRSNSIFIFLTAHNWQKWKRVFLICHCHKIYRAEAVGLKSCKYIWKITILVKMWNLGQYPENLIFCQ